MFLGIVGRLAEPADGLAVAVLVGKYHALVHEQVVVVAWTLLAVGGHLSVVGLDAAEGLFGGVGAYQIVEQTVDEALVAAVACHGECLAIEHGAALKVVEHAIDIAYHVVDAGNHVAEAVVFAQFETGEEIFHGLGIGAAHVVDVADVAGGLGTGVFVLPLHLCRVAAHQDVEGHESTVVGLDACLGFAVAQQGLGIEG